MRKILYCLMGFIFILACGSSKHSTKTDVVTIYDTTHVQVLVNDTTHVTTIVEHLININKEQSDSTWENHTLEWTDASTGNTYKATSSKGTKHTEKTDSTDCLAVYKDSMRLMHQQLDSLNAALSFKGKTTEVKSDKKTWQGLVCFTVILFLTIVILSLKYVFEKK